MLLLKNLSKITIYRKILSLIILSSLFFFGLFFSLYYYTIQQEKEVYDVSLKQFDNEVSSLIELNSQTNISNIVDMVYWDEFVDYLSTKNKHWFDENITSSVDTYNADYLGIYDINGNFVSKSSKRTINTINFIPKQIFEQIYRKKLVNFCIKIPEGYVQVFGASVHVTKDIYKKQTKPSGYFFIVKLLDRQYFSNLEKLNNSTISFLKDFPDPESNIYVTRDLKSWDNKTLAKLLFVRQFDVSFHTTKNILLLLIFTYLLSVIVYLVYSREWLYKPLSLITNILEKGNENDMESLKHIPGEFRYIGTLLKESSKQKKMLEIAKAKAEENDKLKSSFLTNISHEIRTPMNAIIGFSDMLLNADLKEEERAEYSAILHKSGLNLVSIIDDLIEMSKIDTNQIQPNYNAIDIDSFLDELHRTIQIALPEPSKIIFEIKKTPNPLNGKIITDAIKLRQILTNLITNAIKYTEEGFIIVTYGINAEEKEIEFSVKDSGIGIHPKNHKKIFDRFYRIDNDITIKAGGLGLGLAISKAYVKMLGGDIWIQSDKNQGTTFSFTIPLKYGKKLDAVNTDVAQKTPQINKLITIVVAEDNNINFLLLQKMLHLQKHRILRAENGQEAVDICTVNNVDLVLMDIKMPVMDGYTAFKHIRKIKPELAIIAQTAYASSEDEKMIKKKGFSGYLSKPIDKDKLLEIISDVIKQKYKDA